MISDASFDHPALPLQSRVCLVGGGGIQRTALTSYTLRHLRRGLTAARALITGDHGQDLIEYVLLASFISVSTLGGASLMGRSIDGWFTALAAVVAPYAADDGPGAGGNSGGGQKSNCSAAGKAASGGKC